MLKSNRYIVFPDGAISCDEIKETVRLLKYEGANPKIVKHKGQWNVEAEKPARPTSWTVRSKSELDVVYVVTRDREDNFFCSCPDFQYRGGLCKHIKKIKMQLAGKKQKNKLSEAKL